jgi:hypothetical protein
MQMTGIEAYEGRWEKDVIPAKGKTYRITTTSKLAEGLHQDVWFTGSDHALEGYLYQCDVIETAPSTGPEATERIIVLQVKDILPLKNILADFPELEYPTELDEEFNHLMDGLGWFGNKLIIQKIATGTYSLNIDYYGNLTEIITTEYEGKMIAWLTCSGFGIHRFYFGKYILPAWLKEKIDHPEEHGNVRYYDLGEY